MKVISKVFEVDIVKHYVNLLNLNQTVPCPMTVPSGSFEINENRRVYNAANIPEETYLKAD